MELNETTIALNNAELHEQFAAHVEVLLKPGADVLAELDEFKANLIHLALGVAGEAGELLDAVKKHTMYGKELDVTNIVEELGDLEFYLQGIRTQLHLSREITLVSNIVKLSHRYPNGYSNAAAIARKDKAE